MVNSRSPLHHLVNLLLLLGLVRAQFKNVSVDDTDPSVVYNPAGAWSVGDGTILDFPYASTSSHHLTTLVDHPGSNAVFTFTGVAVYFLSPKWPYSVNSSVALDGESGDCIDLYDRIGVPDAVGHETITSAPLWSRENLANTQHTVTVSGCPGGSYVVVDGFFYTILDSSASSTIPPSSNTHSTLPATSTTTIALSASTTSVASKNHVMAIAIGSAIAGVVALGFLLLLGVVLWSRRTQSKNNNKSRFADNLPYVPVPNPANMGMYPGVSGFAPGPTPPAAANQQYDPHLSYHQPFVGGFAFQGSQVTRPNVPEL